MLDSRRDPAGTISQGSSRIAALFEYSVAYTATSVTAIQSSDQDVTVPGVLAADTIISVSPPTNSTHARLVGAKVKSANTVTLTFMNPTAGNLTPTAGTYNFFVARHSVP